MFAASLSCRMPAAILDFAAPITPVEEWSQCHPMEEATPVGPVAGMFVELSFCRRTLEQGNESSV
jgi:hypothetical protein